MAKESRAAASESKTATVSAGSSTLNEESFGQSPSESSLKRSVS